MGICNTKEKKPELIQGINSESKNPELYARYKPIPISIMNKALKSICKITVKTNKGIIFGNGFFMNIDNSKRYLITSNHIISQKVIYDEILIEIHNHKIMKLNMNNREIKYFASPKDITIIEIKNTDEIYNDINFLDYDNVCLTKGYNIYNNVGVFSIFYSPEDGEVCSSGHIIKINDYEFEHDISTDIGSTGSPIILYNTNINSIKVIGMHKPRNYKEKINLGTFIGEIFNIKNNNMNKSNNNYIIGEINIKAEDVQKDLRIINSYEKYCRENNITKIKKEEMNEYEINKCEIKINDKIIPFNYFYKFPQKGKYIIKYIFNNYLTNMSYLFNECKSLTNINLSNFNTQNVTNMSHMFSFCESLTNINLSNFNTQNVTDMSWMFSGCISLTNINLSNFNTQNVANMSHMFSRCKSLININLSNFNTNNVIYINHMFCDCKSLQSINLSNFNTQKVTKMDSMFSFCESLTNINLTNFNTNNVTDMSWMFSGCKSLTNINLSNFNTQKVTDMSGMFSHCYSLTNINLYNFNTKSVINKSSMFSYCKSLKRENIIIKDNGLLKNF